MRILIIHASTHGQTRKIADTIAGHLRAAGHEVDLADVIAARPPPLAGYDAVILGSRIQMERHARELEAYVRDHLAELGAVPSAFFSVSMSATDAGAAADPRGYIEKFFRTTGWRPKRWVAFGGALRYRDYNFVLRFVMKMISKRAGHPTDTSRNHDCTDWGAVERFAAELAPIRAARKSQ